MRKQTANTARGAALLRRVLQLIGIRGPEIPPLALPLEAPVTPAFHARLDLIEQRLTELAQAVQTSGGRQNEPETDTLQPHLETLTRHLEVLSQQMQATPASQNGRTDESVKDAISTLEKQVIRAGREQFKANSLIEAQTEKFAAALELLQAESTRRDAELTALQTQMQTATKTARLEVARALFPVLDGLDEALRSGQHLLEQPEPPPAEPTFFARMWGHKAPPPDNATHLREGMAAWLVGLTFVRQRLLDLLAAETIQPIDAQGQPFDPQLHIAIEVVPASADYPPGTVVTELRRGYQAGERVLRHTEVAVSSENVTQQEIHSTESSE